MREEKIIYHMQYPITYIEHFLSKIKLIFGDVSTFRIV